MSDSPFAPFQPPGTTPTPQGDPPETAKQKAAREKREAKAFDRLAAKTTQTEAPKRRSTGTPKSLKFDLQTILSAAATLNQDDYPLFEKLINLLDEAGKPGRERLLEAVNKVFA